MIRNKAEAMKLNIGVIGVGYWNHYVRILSEHQNVDQIYVCDLKQENLDRVTEKYPSVITATDFNYILSKPEIEGVILCTPVKTHCKIGEAVLNTNRSLLCEKAMTYTSDEAQRMINSSKMFGGKLCIGHTFEYNSLVQHIQKLLDEKVLGEIYYISMTRVGMSPVRQDVNALWDLGAHDFSMLIKWFGMPQSISSFGKSYLNDGIEDFVTTNVEFENNVIANIKNSWINPIKRRVVTIIGSKKMLEFDDIEKSLVIYDNDGKHKLDIEYKQPLSEQVNDFIDSILHDRQPLVTWESGLRVVKVLEAAQKSLKNNSEKVML